MNALPIRSVRPADANGNPIGPAITDLPAASNCNWTKSDLSDPDAGRTISGRMLKKRRGKTDKLELKWNGLTRVQAAAVLQAFDSEYLLVEYLDARAGQWVTKHFYGGDMQAKGWLPHIETWEVISLSIIQATPDPP